MTPMRPNLARNLGLALLLVALVGCPEERPPDSAPPSTASQGGEAAASRSGSGDPDRPGAPAGAGMSPEGGDASDTAASEPAVAAEELDPRSFAGFSADETRFAYSAYSAGADTHIFTIVDSRTGRRVIDFPLDGEAELEKARALLREGGFTPRKGERSPAFESGATLRVEAGAAGVTVQVGTEGEQRTVALPEGFRATVAHFDAPQAQLWGLSPSGRLAAIRLSQDAGPELGKAVTYVVVDLGL